MSKKAPFKVLIDVSESKVEQVARRLGILQAEQISAQQKIDMLFSYRQEYAERLESQMQIGNSASYWKNFQYFINTLDEAIAQQQAIVNAANARLEMGRQDWRLQKKRLNSFCMLQQRQVQRALYQVNKREQNESDELNTSKHQRGRIF